MCLTFVMNIAKGYVNCCLFNAYMKYTPDWSAGYEANVIIMQ